MSWIYYVLFPSECNKCFDNNYFNLIWNTFFTLTTLCLFIIIKKFSDYAIVPIPQTFFIEKDPTLSYPFVTGQVSSENLYLISCLIPFGMLIISSIIMNIFFRYKHIKNMNTKKIYTNPTPYYIYQMLMFGLTSFFITSIITDILKNVTGVLRPNFFAYCNYNGYNDAIISENFTNYNLKSEFGRIGSFSKCYNYNNDILRSFPSGHASVSFVCMTITSIIISYMSYYIFKKYNIVFSSLFLILSSWISLTRVQDYKHHTIDIVTGAIIGMIVPLIILTSYHTELKRNFDDSEKDCNNEQILEKNKNSIIVYSI
jgi:membrane-associated phospholipid phosphatase